MEVSVAATKDIPVTSFAVVSLREDLHLQDRAHADRNLSNAVMKNIKQNLFFALIYNTFGVPIAAGVLFPFFGILLTPMLAALAMSFSSVSVIANALRLRNLYI